MYLSTSFFLILVLWALDVFSFLRLLYGISSRVPSTGLMVSSLEVDIVAACLRMAAYLSCDGES